MGRIPLPPHGYLKLRSRFRWRDLSLFLNAESETDEFWAMLLAATEEIAGRRPVTPEDVETLYYELDTGAARLWHDHAREATRRLRAMAAALDGAT